MENTTQTSLFAQALGSAWDDLHPAVRRHYDLHPGESIQLIGEMSEVFHSHWVKPLILAGRLMGALVPYRGRDIPVEVRNFCEPGNHHLQWRRRFFFPGRAPYPFASRMAPLAGNEIVEYVRFGLGIRMRLSVCEGALCYTTNGYLWRLGPLNLTLPDWLLFGSGTITERGIGENEVELDFTLSHPLFGKSFRYAGRFQFQER